MLPAFKMLVVFYNSSVQFWTTALSSSEVVVRREWCKSTATVKCSEIELSSLLIVLVWTPKKHWALRTNMHTFPFRSTLTRLSMVKLLYVKTLNLTICQNSSIANSSRSFTFYRLKMKMSTRGSKCSLNGQHSELSGLWNINRKILF